jgi:NAD(P)-dependent dehydrogenase (short-subunit alcohol dehydrogenase family)
MDLELEGAGALVTGGSKGIGKAVARALMAEGARVALLARDPAGLARAAAELGGDVVVVRADTTDTAAVTAAVDEAARALGRLDVVVNAAARVGAPGSGGLAGFDERDALDDVDTKALGYVRVIAAAVPHLRAAGGGRVVNIAGMAARSTGSITGSLRNSAVVTLTKNLADELGAEGISVCCVHPGLTRTDSREFTDAMHTASTSNALGRTIDAREVAHVVAFLASPKGLVANGAVVTADGGRRGGIWA